jgi:hypothetical protein
MKYSYYLPLIGAYGKFFVLQGQYAELPNGLIIIERNGSYEVCERDLNFGKVKP